MPLRHFGSLEPCSCGAYRYLAARDHKKSIEIVYIHQLGKVRLYTKVASVPRLSLLHPGARNRGPENGDSLPQNPLRLRGRFTIVIAEDGARDKSPPDGQETAEGPGVHGPERAVVEGSSE